MSYDFAKQMKEHGATPQGVGWGSEETQEARFAVLQRLFYQERPSADYSLMDIGCGYGALLNSIVPPPNRYVGLDTHEAALQATQETIDKRINAYDYQLGRGEVHLVDAEDPLIGYWEENNIPLQKKCDIVYCSGVL
jgi:SAM-dependent methyltransferase